MVKIQHGSYAAAWHEHRRRDRWVWAAFLGYIPGVMLLGTLLGMVFGTEMYLVTAIAWMIVASIVNLRAATFRCPRCGEQFYSRGLFHNGFTRRCLHCGLAKWASEDSDVSV